jgi:hypothetical protein
MYIGQIKEPNGGYSPLWATFVNDPKTGDYKQVLYKQPTQGRPCSMSLMDGLIKSTVPVLYRGSGGFDFLTKLWLYIEFDYNWGKCRTTHELTREQAAWIRKNNRKKQRIRSPSASGEADVPRNKKQKPNNADAKSPADDTRERDTAGMRNWDIWSFGRKLGKMAQDAGLALHDKFRQYNAKGDDAQTTANEGMQ